MVPPDERYPVEAPGWRAIDGALAVLYRDAQPHQFASRTPYDLESTTPLPAITVYEAAGEGAEPAHWHYVTYGLSELFEKTSPQADVSGNGYELTFRLPREQTGEPPRWPLYLLHGIGGAVLSGSAALDTGHVVDLGDPLVPEALAPPGAAPTALRGVLCVPDPRLGKIGTPYGSLLFLSLFGVTADEMEALQAWPMKHKVGLVADVAPLAITRPDRTTYRDDPRTAPAFRRHALGMDL